MRGPVVSGILGRMTQTDHEHLLTAEEFAKLPISKGVELIDGRIVEKGMTGVRHGQTALMLIKELLAWAPDQWAILPEVDFILARDPDRIRRPDVAWLREGRVVRGVTGFFEGAPDLAVEVLSPTDPVGKTEERIQDYLDAGTRLVWIVNPFGRYVIAYSPGSPPRLFPSGSTLDGGDVLAGFSCAVSDLFPP